jgi:hypothetical protein
MSEHQLGNAHECSLLAQNTESFKPKVLSNENSLSRFASCNRFEIKYLNKGKLKILSYVIRVFRMAYHFYLNTQRGGVFFSFSKPQVYTKKATLCRTVGRLSPVGKCLT